MKDTLLAVMLATVVAAGCASAAPTITNTPANVRSNQDRKLLKKSPPLTTISAGHAPKLMTVDLSVLRDPEPIVFPVQAVEWSDSSIYRPPPAELSMDYPSPLLDDYEDYRPYQSKPAMVQPTKPPEPPKVLHEAAWLPTHWRPHQHPLSWSWLLGLAGGRHGDALSDYLTHTAQTKTNQPGKGGKLGRFLKRAGGGNSNNG